MKRKYVDLMSDSISILDSSLNPGEIRLIRIRDELGFNVVNKTGKHLFIEPKFRLHKLVEIVIHDGAEID